MTTAVCADDTVAPTVFNCKGTFFDEDVQRGESMHASGTWHLPERGE